MREWESFREQAEKRAELLESVDLEEGSSHRCVCVFMCIRIHMCVEVRSQPWVSFFDYCPPWVLFVFPFLRQP